MPDYEANESPLQTEEASSDADGLMNNLSSLKLQLPDNINREPRAYIYREKNDNWGPSRYLIDVDGSNDTLSDNYSTPNGTNGDGGSKTLLRCQFCDSDVMLCVQQDRLHDGHIFDPEKMICPLCDEKFEEDTIMFVQNSILQKRAWKSEKYNILYGTSAMADKKPPSWEEDSVSVPRLSDIQSSLSDTESDEDFTSISSHTSIAESSETEAADTSEEQEQKQKQDEDDEEKSLRAKFVRDLVLSTMI